MTTPITVYVVLHYDIDGSPSDARVCGVFSSRKLANHYISLAGGGTMEGNWAWADELQNDGSAVYEVSSWVLVDSFKP